MTKVLEEAHDLLKKTETGQKIIEAVGEVKIDVVETDKYQGRTLSPTEIEINKKMTLIPNLACLLAHEYTHCIDLGFWEGQKIKRTIQEEKDFEDSKIGLTEINAHFNQGKVCRELQQWANNKNPLKNVEMQTSINSMVAGSTTYGQSYKWKTRSHVKTYLLGTTYKDNLLKTIKLNDATHLWIDDYWGDEKDGFHCEKHFHDDNKWTEHWASTHGTTNESIAEEEELIVAG